MSAQARRIEDGDDFQDTGLVLAVFRPQTARDWAMWRARRDAARQGVAARALDAGDERLLLAALGLDDAGEAALLERIGG